MKRGHTVEVSQAYIIKMSILSFIITHSAATVEVDTIMNMERLCKT
jgi:hypothetical protein